MQNLISKGGPSKNGGIEKISKISGGGAGGSN